MRDTLSLSRENAFPVVLKFAKSFFSLTEDFQVRYSPGQGYVLFPSSSAPTMTRADFDKLLSLFEEPPFNASLRRSWDRGDMDAFETLIRDAVNQNFPPFEDL